MAEQPPGGQGLLIVETSPSHLDTPLSVRFLWTSDQPDAETSTWQHTSLTKDRLPCFGRDSNPTNPPIERPQTYALARAATGIVLEVDFLFYFSKN